MANQKSTKEIIKQTWNRLMHGQWLVKHVGFALFLSLLAVLYIANGHHTENTIREIAKAEKQLKDQQFLYKTLKAEVMFRGKESEMAKAVAPLGLKRLETPPLNLSARYKNTQNNKQQSKTEYQ